MAKENFVLEKIIKNSQKEEFKLSKFLSNYLLENELSDLNTLVIDEI